MNIQYIDKSSKSYPSLLGEISSPPKGLYVLGKIPDLPMIAIVGTRLPTDYGRVVTYKLAKGLAQAGFCLVSGLALGIDSIVHQAAIDAKGYTVAVLGCGVDEVYPRANRQIYTDIIGGRGAVISEYPPQTRPFKSYFPARNRIIAGMSMALIVTEADSKSGSLISANFALQQNKQVMAVPGNINNPKSVGPNNLIKLGANLIGDYSDVLALLDLQLPAAKKVKPKADSKEEANLIELLEGQALSTEQLIEKTGLEAAQIASVISLMEITGKIRNIGSGVWMLN